MISAKCYYAWKRRSLFGWANLLRIGSWRTRENAVMTFFDLLQGVRIVVRSDWNVTAVDYGRPVVERIRVKWNIVTTTEAYLA